MGRDSLPPPPPPPIEDYGMMRISQLPDPPYISSVMVNAPPPAPMAPPPPPLPSGGVGGAGSPPPVRESRESSTESELPLPPPPPIPAEMAPPPEERHQAGPPPPPPPPMPMSSPPPRPPLTNGDVRDGSIGSPGRGDDGFGKSAPGRNIVGAPAPALDGRSDLLKAIRDGISLRKVEKGQEQSEKCRMDEGLCDVASILARRVAMEFSDSDSGSESGSGSDWDDETST